MRDRPAEPPNPNAVSCDQGWQFYLELIETNRRLEATNAQLQATVTELQTALRHITVLERMKNQPNRFVPATVQKLIEDNPEEVESDKQEQDVTVLFLDIESWTQLCDTLDQSDLNLLIEVYFSRFLETIYTHQGDMNETVGDGFMALFQTGMQWQHARAAATAAIEIQQTAQQLHEHLHGSLPALAVKVGINSGLAWVGVSKFTGRRGSRWTYTASGSVTNLASRLAAHAPGGAILVGAEMNRRIRDTIPLQALGKRHMKGLASAVNVYEVMWQEGPHGRD